ncbi:MAG: fluoride efflux transporter CrcB [Chitinophagales bacterium]
MMKYVYILLGGAAGSLIRFVLVDFITSKNSSSFPSGTLSVNLIGSLCIGFLFGFFSLNGEVDERLKFLVFIGFLGGFTTFSSFALENVKLINEGLIGTSLFYILISNVAGLALAFAGYFTGIKIK